VDYRGRFPDCRGHSVRDRFEVVTEAANIGTWESDLRRNRITRPPQLEAFHDFQPARGRSGRSCPGSEQTRNSWPTSGPAVEGRECGGGPDGSRTVCGIWPPAGETSGRRQLAELDLDAQLLSAAQYGQSDCVTWLMTVDGFRERRLALEGLGVDGGDDVLLPDSGRCGR
jgi:hypothetical protein